MAEKKSLYGRIFGGIWRLVDAFRKFMIFLLILLSAGLFVLLVVAAVPKPIEENIALVWAPVGEIVEASTLPAGSLLPDLPGTAPQQTELRDLLQALDFAAKDSRIKLLYLKLDGLTDVGYGQLQSLVSALHRFRNSGKKIVAFAPGYSQGQYLLAAQADELYLDPLGGVLMPGMSRYAYYFRDALDKLEVDVHVFRAGTYKSAVEPFERNDMSPEAAAATRAWMDVLWDDYVGRVAQARELDRVVVHGYAENLPENIAMQGGDTAQVALAAGLVDELATLHEVRSRVGATVGMDDKHGSFRQVHHHNYLARMRHEQKEQSPNRIGWLVVEGALMDGEGEPGVAGAEAIARRLDDVRREDKLKALVVRVNSPGGSVTASETLRRALNRMEAADIPVVVSMASVAASGGYWMSMDAGQIWAESGTLTGSIGVFGVLPNLTRALSGLGVYADGVSTTETAGDLRPDRPLSEQAKAAIQSLVEYNYRLFVDGVAKGRELTKEATIQAAEGRVWSGKDALRLGLVDHLGGPDMAIKAAADLAGLDSYQVTEISVRPDLMTLLKYRFRLSLRALQPALSPWLEPVQGALNALHWLRAPNGVYAHCLCETRV